MNTITTIGLDIAKSNFSAHCTDVSGTAVKKTQLKRSQILAFFAGKAPCKVGIEACGSSYHWAREIGKFGHEVRLIPAGRVKGFVLRAARTMRRTPAPSRKPWPIPRRVLCR